jgi:pyruvate dehydrogenase E1 component beta subunit
LRVVAPYDSASAKGLLKASILDPNPVIFLENEMLYGKSFPADPGAGPMSLDKAIVRRLGSDVTIVAFSLMVDVALQAADALVSEGIDVEVVDLCILRPWDQMTILQSVHKTHRLVTLEEGWPICGIGSEIVAHVSDHRFDDLDAPPVRVTGLDVPMSYAANHERMSLPCVQQVIEAVRTVMGRG